MAVAVHLANSVETFLQGLAVRGKANDGQDNGGVLLVCCGASDLEKLGVVSRVDAVARCQTGIAGHDGEVGASDGKCRAAVVRVSVKPNCQLRDAR